MYQYTKVQFVKRTDYYDVIVYYSKNGEKFRPPTDVKVSLKNLVKDKKGNQTISSKHPNLDEDLEKIREVQDKAESLIKSYVDKYKEKPPVDWLETAFSKKQVDVKKDLLDALCYWPEFIEEKRQTIRNETTLNRYENLKGMLRQFSERKNYSLSFSVLDQKFFNELLEHMVTDHEFVRNPAQRNEDSGVIPETGLSNETAIKRLKDFVEYLKFCSVEYDVDIKVEKIKKYIKLSRHKLEVKPLSKTKRWELTLTPDEIEFSVNLHHYEPDFWNSITINQRRYLDIFIFMCLQGTAPIDTKSIGRQDIMGGKIVKERSKTGNEFRVELDPISLDILERNNYNLNFTEQTLNDELKKIYVTIFELYRKHYEAKYDQPYQIICTQLVKKGNTEIYKIQHKGLFVELMSGRRSFLTNLGEKANELGLKETMDKAGHVKVETTLGYIHNRQQGKKTKTGLFGIKKIEK
jgi:hypothetical protein